MDQEIKHVLVTGGFGFLGRSLVKKLLEKDYRVSVIEKLNNDNNNPFGTNIYLFDAHTSQFKKIFNNQIDLIIHTATIYGRNKEKFQEILHSNLVFPLQLLEIAIKHKVPYFINTDTTLKKSTNTYTLTKKQFLDWLIFYKESIHVINLSLEHFYGHGANDSNFITLMVKKLLSNEPEINLTLGEQKRNFVYISDVVKAYLLIIENLNQLKIGVNLFDVSSDENISIKNLMLKLKKFTKSTSSLNFGAIPYRKNEIMEPHTNNSSLKQLGWLPIVTLDDGLKRIIDKMVLNKK